MQLYIMRHGETNYNIAGLCNDDPKQPVYLTERGIHRAQQAADALAKVHFEKIFVSHLPRTQQTAEIINQHHQVDIECSAYLNDIRSGFDGQPVADYFAAVGHDRYNLTPPNGESVRRFQQRLLQFLNVIGKSQLTCVLVVTHEEAMRVLYAHFHDLSVEDMLKLNFCNCEYFCASL